MILLSSAGSRQQNAAHSTQQEAGSKNSTIILQTQTQTQTRPPSPAALALAAPSIAGTKKHGGLRLGRGQLPVPFCLEIGPAGGIESRISQLPIANPNSPMKSTNFYEIGHIPPKPALFFFETHFFGGFPPKSTPQAGFRGFSIEPHKALGQSRFRSLRHPQFPWCSLPPCITFSCAQQS